MAIVLTISGILAIFLGIIVLIWPKVLNYAIGFYLILIGILQILPQLGFEL